MTILALNLHCALLEMKCTLYHVKISLVYCVAVPFVFLGKMSRQGKIQKLINKQGRAGFTVMCILVWMKSFPRFWRNHTYCRNKLYLIWMGCLFPFRWSKKKIFEEKIKTADSEKPHFPAPPLLNIKAFKIVSR